MMINDGNRNLINWISEGLQNAYEGSLNEYIVDLEKKYKWDLINYSIIVYPPKYGMDIFLFDPDYCKCDDDYFDFGDYEDDLMIAHNHAEDFLYLILNYKECINLYKNRLLDYFRNKFTEGGDIDE